MAGVVDGRAEALGGISSQGRQQQLGALIIDLRGNQGGSLRASLDLAAYFLPRGAPLMRFHVHGHTRVYHSRNKQSLVDTPLLLLLDSATASASEIFATALQDHKRATVMGSQSVGKNIAQVIFSSSMVEFH